ncbi:uncharacterized protein LOC110384111 [Helicoverpa armigera]|uniref:uncharacterized protein LOC110384111 n=1 Tax=Helicoverpa armigera TaxID=29058 RepID=UPI003082F12C
MAKLIIFLLFLTTYFCISHGCRVVGTSWPNPVSGSVVDTYRGVILDIETRGIDGIESVTYGAAINYTQYVDFNFIDSRLVASTNPLFDEYEEKQTVLVMQAAVTFRCSDGSSPVTYNFFINVVDTNNNAPQFWDAVERQPRDEFEFTVIAPLPPGFEITGCLDDLIVRDIDLTTSRIDFAIEDNDYFEIEYGGLTVAKEFQGILKTKTLIRSIPEPITLTISATDVDDTGDPPITTKGKITIIGDREFEMPEEPVFTKAFYLADYTEDNRVVLEETISLRSGYHSDVDFSIEGEFKNNFEIVTNPQYENQMSIGVTIPLTGDVLDQPNVLLAVKANREHTSGASTTVVVRLPQGIPLEFERAHYEGTIENNILDVPPLILTQGYEGTVVSANVISDYTSNFNAVVQGNTITLSMTPLAESIINQNSFIYLQIVASTDRSITTTVVTLEIIKDDNITPVFNQPIYTGSYNPGADLSIEQISFTQGYDGIDSLELFGDNSNYFTATRLGASVRITVSTIPPALYSLGRIVLSLGATKPRTVGASATLIINLPGARELGFESSTYRGSLQNNVLTLDPIPLTLGYDENIDFSLTGDYASYFRVSKEENRAIIRLETPIPNEVILENNIVMLTLAASGLNAVTTTTSVLLDIIKDDTTTPVFSRNIYYGTYLGSNINIDDIILTQGYDSSVTFRLDGDHAQYFDVSNTGNRVEIVQLSPIPEGVIHNEKVLVFNVLALKALTVGANAAVSISFPSELTDPVVMRFAQNTYTATIDNNGLTADHIVLSTGYAPGTEFVHTGDYSSYFSITPNENRVTLSLLNPLPTDVIPNSFVVLEIAATRERAVSASTSIVVDIIQEEIVPPKFTQPFYRGVYDPESGLQFNEVISLLYGHDDTVDFHLDGEFSSLFRLVELDSKSRSIEVLAPISEEVLKDNSHLLFTVVATKPGSYTARATISIDIVKESPQGTLGFDRVTYLGTIQNDVAHVGPITIIQGFTDDVTLALYGDLAVYFTTRREASVVTVTMVTPIPRELIPDNRIIVLEIRASSPQANTAFATIVLEAILEDDTPPTIQLAFDAPFYTGSYNTIDGLRLDTSIALAGGHDANTQFGLQGENSQWFSVSPGSNTVTIVVSSAIPEAVLASNRKFVFLITAQRPGALSAQATIVISLTADESPQGPTLGFDRVTYLGTIQNDVAQVGPITIIQGFTDDVTLALYGDLAVYFTTRRLLAIPEAVLASNRKFVFLITAQRPGALSAQATIVISLTADESPQGPTLGFDRVTYLGTIQNDVAQVGPITIIQGFTDDVTLALYGDLAVYFTTRREASVVTVTMVTPIPTELIPDNRIVVLEIRASSPQANTAFATIVLEAILEDDTPPTIQLAFDAPFYTGSYNTIDGLRLDTSIALAGGHDANTQFGPRRHRELSAQATIVISLTADESPQGPTLGFDRVTYLGTIQNDVAQVGPITIIQGFTDDVTLALYGDLAVYFTTRREASVVTVTMVTPIPTELIPDNRIVVLEIRASSPQANTAFATIVLEAILEDDTPPTIQLAFDAPFYTGSYNTIDGLRLDTSIALAGGHDANTQFGLQGENSQWFSVSAGSNSVTIVVSSAIPEAVLASNRKFVFLITAQRPGALTAQATIVISLTADESPQGPTLGFDRVTYLGTIQNDVAQVGPITIIQGFTDDVTLALYGDLAVYFTTRRRLLAIPEAVLASNRKFVFVITAQRPGALSAQATIVISLTADESPQGPTLGFDRVTYLGTIQNDVAQVGPITIIQGFTDDVTLALYGGKFPSSITLHEPSGGLLHHSEASVVTVTMVTPIPTELIPENRIVVLEIRASSPQANTAFATIVLEAILEDDTPPTIQLAFDAPFYTGSYNTIDGLRLDTSIALAGGHDANTQFGLQGENSQWFSVSPGSNTVTIVVSSAIPEAVLASNRKFVFLITAQRPGALSAQATIVISLTADESPQGPTLGFDRVTYLGTIQNDVAQVGPITIIQGFTDDVTLALYGGKFPSSITLHEPSGGLLHHSEEASVVTVTMVTPIPTELIPDNRIVVLEIRASSPQANTAFATIVLEAILEDDTPPTIQLAFDAPFYTGSYNTIDGLRLDTSIALAGGHDANTQFGLQGENSQWFSVSAGSNSVSIVVSSAIPEAVLASNRKFVFLITAQRPGALSAQATIVISLTADESPQGPTLGFDRVTYLGTIQNDVAQVGPITIIQGFTDDVTLALYGDLAVYFTTRREASVVTVTMVTPIPTELIPDNRIVVLEIRASSPQANTAFATIVLEAILEDDTPPTIQLAFDAPFYTGSYNTIDGLRLDTSIALAGGHDANTQFGLQGENSQWFSVSAGSNSVSIVVSSAIPEAVLASNRKFVFLITAQRPGALTAQATIVISLTADESPQGPTLGFDRVTYLGTIQNDVAQVGPITIIQGFTDDVTLALYGGKFPSSITLHEPSGGLLHHSEASVVTVTMVTPIPTELIPDNRIVVLEIRASSPQANTAFATIVLEAILEDDTSTIQLAFDAPFYTGSYNTIDGLRLDTSIALAGGHDANTQFGLQGENSQWFSVSPGSNTVTIVVSSAIPEAVLASNRKFVFVITAQRPGALSAQATIVISLTADESPQGPTLGFDRVTYLGTIQNDVAQVGPITIIQGFTDDVTLALYGDLAVYFTTRREASVVTVTMVTPIPTELIPDNRIVVLEIRASSPQANTAFATIVLEAILEDDTPPTIQLAFDAPFYTGSYNTIDGLRLDTSIALAGGHDANTQFGLQGENSQWFSVSPGSNTVTIVVSSAIPEAVLASNRKFVFVITAQRPGALSAQATIVISLTADESPQGPTLGFDRVTYLGTIQNDVAQVGPITIIQGFTDDVTLALYGDLAVYFTTRREASVVTVTMVTPIPTELIPDNRIVVLEIRASSPQANTAFATIVLEAILEDDTPPTIQLAFDAPFYTGSYNTIDGLRLDTSIALAGGHDANTQFGLQGENSQWFSVSAGSNSVSIVVSSAIPEAVLASNRKFVFLITAQRPGALSAQATIVISLTADESPQGPTLGFDRVTYLGTIQNDVAHVGPITIIQGFTDDVTLALYGDLAVYFTTRREASVVTVTMVTPIPTELIPDNRIVVLEIRASSPQANTAFATIVLEAILEDDTPPTIQLAFDAPFYTGSYNTIDGLRLDTSIALAGGHDANTQFGLQGENSQWFSVSAGSNSVSIVVSSAIPEAVLASNRKFVFLITAQRPGALSAQATIVISLTADESPQGPTLGFDRVTYLGTIQNDVAQVGPITIIQGFTDDVTLALYGDLAVYFTTRREASVVTVTMVTPIPTELIPDNRIVVLEIRASSPQANTAFATIVLEAILEDDTPPTIQLAFDAPFYTGSYNTIDGLRLDTSIALAGGHDANTQFGLQGENSQWFSVSPGSNTVTIVVSSAIPEAVLASNRKFVFVITAQRPGALSAQATIVISLTADESPQGPTLGFDRVTYLGTIQNDVAQVGPITIIQGFTDDVTLALYGDLAVYFTTRREASVVTVTMVTPIPTELIPDNRIVVLEIRASSPQANTAFATIVLEAILEDDTPPTIQLAFDAPFYTGSYNTIDGLRLDTSIALAGGHDANTQFGLQGENSQWFSVSPGSNTVTIVVSSAIPEAVLASNRKFVFVITAQRPGALSAQATIVISLTADESPQGPTLGFDRVTYLGTIQNDVAQVGPITIIQGFTDDVTLALYGDLAVYFTTRREASVVTVTMVTPIPTELIPDNRIVVLEIRASSPQANTAFATIVLEAILEDDTPPTIQLAFDAPFYTGSYNTIDGLRLDTSIALAGGHDANTQFGLQGENSQWFSVSAGSNSVTIVVSSAIPEAVLASNRKFVFLITAQRPGALSAQATIVIAVTEGSSNGNDAEFEYAFYEGVIQGNDVRHELVRIFGYDGTTVDVIGDYSSLFMARALDGVVTVGASGTLNLPDDVTRVVLELQAAGARTAMVLNVEQSDAPILPTVTFSSETYEVTVGIAQTGLIGRVSATTNNGEAVTYSLGTLNAHLQTRLSINNEGELHLSAPANSGVYTFQVVATSVITQATGTATVTLAVEAVTVCEDGEIVVPPLIIIDRDEEQAHRNLVVLDPEQQSGCHYTMTHRWPTNANWLYVDENGLHANVIDREHPSIAFMALSQVQVELILHCENDNPGRSKRSERTDWLGPYDYGSNKWILTDTILYNSRRSLVNLIVNDINDNDPIFVGKEHEPIVVGYPTDDLEERILPRSLVELKATDADVGENAQLMYSSAESSLAVAPTTGFVHVRSGATLVQDQILTVRATDQNGNGRTGTIQLMVKLLDLSHIAVVTVRDAFLDDETTVLNQLSAAVGYEVKSLRSVVISDDIDGDVTRKTREANNGGASLQLYVYGLIAREPVVVERLTTDISTNAANVNVISTLTLEDHLEDMYIFERDIGLLVATIVLSVLLFMLIVVIAIWFFLRWRKSKKYNELSEENSIASRNSSLGEVPKPEPMKPRLNIEDLKRSEKRLQERLEAPIEEISVEPMTSRKLESPVEAILDMPVPEVSPPIPIVIQSIDKLKDADDDDDTDDEFGEVTAPRKSVVTFNENVEKIITVEDDAEDDGDSSQAGYEVYRL